MGVVVMNFLALDGVLLEAFFLVRCFCGCCVDRPCRWCLFRYDSYRLIRCIVCSQFVVVVDYFIIAAQSDLYELPRMLHS